MTNGSLSTTKGFTGQLQDPSGLDYFKARYYDPTVGQFISEDTVQGPNRYAYVAGNPETNTDPTGQYIGGGAGCYDPNECTAHVTGTKGHTQIFIQGQQQSNDPKCKGETVDRCDKAAEKTNPHFMYIAGIGWVSEQDLLDFYGIGSVHSIDWGRFLNGVLELIFGVALIAAAWAGLEKAGELEVDWITKWFGDKLGGIAVTALGFGIHTALDGLQNIIEAFTGDNRILDIVFGFGKLLADLVEQIGVVWALGDGIGSAVAGKFLGALVQFGAAAGGLKDLITDKGWLNDINQTGGSGG